MGSETKRTVEQLNEAKHLLWYAVQIILELCPDPPPKPRMGDLQDMWKFIQAIHQECFPLLATGGIEENKPGERDDYERDHNESGSNGSVMG